jgi:hypothetical protein
VLLWPLVVTACDGGVTESRQEDCGPPATTPDTPATVGFHEDILPIFTKYGCASIDCHGGSFPQSDYPLTGYATVFGPGKEAAERGTCDVLPGDAQNSYLVKKVEGRAEVGARMPLGGDPIAPQDLQTIRNMDPRRGSQELRKSRLSFFN